MLVQGTYLHNNKCYRLIVHYGCYSKDGRHMSQAANTVADYNNGC